MIKADMQLSLMRHLRRYIMPKPISPLKYSIPNPSLPIEKQTQVVLVAMCVWGEARGSSYACKVGIADVIRNRVNSKSFTKNNSTPWASVVLASGQFSCFNKTDPNYNLLLEPLKHDSVQVWSDCYEAADLVMMEEHSDTVGGAVFYFDPPITEPPKDWGNVALTKIIGNTKFWKIV